MDVNRTRFLLLAGRDDFALADGADLAWHEQDCLALAPQQAPAWPSAGLAEAPGAAWARDRFHQTARIATAADVPAQAADPAVAIVAGRTILVDAGRGWQALILDVAATPAALRPPLGDFLDLAIGGPPGEERLAALWSDGATWGVTLLHLRTRWTIAVPLAIAVERILVDGAARTWAAGGAGVVRISGAPLPQPYRPQLGRFEPLRIVPDPPRVTWPAVGVLAIPGVGDGVRGLACDAARLYLLAGAADEPVLFLRPLDSDPLDPWTILSLPTAGLALPLSDVAVLHPGRIALLAAFDPVADPGWRRRDCAVFDLPAAANGEVVAVAVRHPFASRPQARFASVADGAVRWRAGGTLTTLQPLEIARFARQGHGTLAASFDSATPGCIWHKITLEARIPAATALRVDVRCADDPADLITADWLEQPAPGWHPLPSELPWADGAVAQRPGEAGLFELLLQRPSGAVRRITGRHLQVRLRFSGDGRSTPALRRLRVHLPRFSYQEHYLPLHFRQQERVLPVDGRANGADFRERLLAVVEGLLTPLEDRVASAELLADPASCPAALLPRLAALIGVDLETTMPLATQRRQVAGAGAVARWKGTMRGLRLALDLACDGAASAGRIIVVENHRLRRTMATLLGVTFSDADNPLTLGTMRSGNSIVGDSLILSAPAARSYLAALDPSLAEADDPTAAQAFFDRYAHQVTVLLHGSARALEDTVRRVLARELPAHLQWTIVSTDHGFVLGLSPLLSVDTVLEREPAPAPVVLDRTILSREGLLGDPAALLPSQVRADDRSDPT